MQQDYDHDELRKLAEAATPGPWMGESGGEKDGYVVVGVAYAIDDENCDTQVAGWPKMWDPETGKELVYRDVAICEMADGNIGANANLIVAMRNALPGLLDELDALRKERDALRAGHKMCHEDQAHYEDGWRKERDDLRAKLAKAEAERDALQEQVTMRKLADAMPDATVPIGRKLLDQIEAERDEARGLLRKLAEPDLIRHLTVQYSLPWDAVDAYLAKVAKGEDEQGE